jgi:hypothetical protein
MIELNDQREWILGELRQDSLCTDCYLCSHQHVVRERIETLWTENVTTSESYAEFLSANSWIWCFSNGCHKRLKGVWTGRVCVACSHEAPGHSVVSSDS